MPILKLSKLTRARIAIFFAMLLSGLACAQTAPPTNYQLLNSIASCTTVACVSGKQNDMDSKVEKAVLYVTWLTLDPSSQTASLGLLENIPATKDELAAFMILRDLPASATSSGDERKRLEAIYQKWPRLLSVAVRKLPGFLPTYIRFGRLAVNDMLSEYTSFETSVCQADQKTFLTAFNSLGSDEQQVIRKHAFNPDTCEPMIPGNREGAKSAR